MPYQGLVLKFWRILNFSLVPRNHEMILSVARGQSSDAVVLGIVQIFPSQSARHGQNLDMKSARQKPRARACYGEKTQYTYKLKVQTITLWFVFALYNLVVTRWWSIWYHTSIHHDTKLIFLTFTSGFITLQIRILPSDSIKLVWLILRFAHLAIPFLQRLETSISLFQILSQWTMV